MSVSTGRLLARLPLAPLQRIDRFSTDPLDTQERLLRRLLRDAAGTEWGRRLDFAGALREKDPITGFQQRSRLHFYDDIQDDVTRLRSGERDVIWPGGFRHFAVSSGTASSGKIIPVSHEMLVSNRAFSVGVALHYLRQTADLGFLGGKHLTLPGRIEEDPRFPGTLVGEVSGLQAEYAPWYFKLLYQSIPNEVAFLPNWERKLDAIAERTMAQDVRMVVMAPTWALVFFKRLIRRHNERRRANATTVREVWPNLRLFISGGVALSSYRDMLSTYIGSEEVQFLETYGASEGFFSFQTDLSDPAMLLHLDNGVFYEFVRADEMRQPAPTRYALRDVEPGVRYAMYVSSCSGLWSYGVKDVVRFTSTDPYKLLVAGRTSEMLDRYGEALFSEEARTAVEQASAQTRLSVMNFHVAPLPGDAEHMPRHEWLVEFDESPADVTAFATAIDNYLQEVNRHYQIRREAKAFDAPRIVVLPRGTFYEWLKRTRERISGQTKVPLMSEEREVADGVLALMQTAA